MSYPFLRPRCGAALLLAAATAAGCATTKPTASPEEEYRQAVEEAQKGHYVEAQRLFESVRDADTPVRLELLAEVGVADALYKGGKFEEAAEAYAKLLEVHSGDAIADYLNYQLGMCFYRRIDTVDRDQGLTRKARTQFMALITRYPESDLAEAAREKLQACNDYLARRELYVGRFYLTRSNHEAAKRRFLRGLGRYGKVEVEPELLHDLCLAEDGLGETQLADQAAERLRHDFPAVAATASLAGDRAQARALRDGKTTDGPLHRIGRWWSDRHPEAEGELREGTATDAVPPAAAVVAPAENPAAAETAPAPAPTVPPSPTTTGDSGAAAEPASPVRISTLDPEAPWPGSTVATDPSRTPTPPVEAAPAQEPPSRWRHLLSWLDHRGEATVEPLTQPPAQPTTTAVEGLIVRRIPPVGAEEAIPPVAVPHIPASRSGIPPVGAEEAIPQAPATTPIPTPVKGEPPRPTPIAIVSTPPTATPPTAPLARLLAAQATAATATQAQAQTTGGDLVVEEFPAVEGETATAPAAFPTYPRGGLADRVEETLGQDPSPLSATTPPADALPVLHLPAPTPPSPQPLVASGEALRHDRPRPLPQPTFTRPSPPLEDEGLPATATADGKIEWHTMTPPVAPVVESVLAPASPAPTAASEPPPTTEAQRHGAFWSGVRERFTSTADE